MEQDGLLFICSIFWVLLFSFNTRKLDSLSMASRAIELEGEREEDRISSNFWELTGTIQVGFSFSTAALQ